MENNNETETIEEEAFTMPDQRINRIFWFFFWIVVLGASIVLARLMQWI
jgi:hypothetical protein